MKHAYQDKEKKAYDHRADGGKDHDKHQSKMPKLSFDELLAKYKKISKANVANRPRKVQLSRLLPKPQEWNW